MPPELTVVPGCQDRKECPECQQERCLDLLHQPADKLECFLDNFAEQRAHRQNTLTAIITQASLSRQQSYLKPVIRGKAACVSCRIAALF